MTTKVLAAVRCVPIERLLVVWLVVVITTGFLASSSSSSADKTTTCVGGGEEPDATTSSATASMRKPKHALSHHLSSSSAPLKEQCGMSSAHCRSTGSAATTTKNTKKETIYQYGGTAQAYKPNVPMEIKDDNGEDHDDTAMTRTTTTTICNASQYSKTKHKVASWPFARWTTTRSNTPSPLLNVTLEFWTCSNRSTAKDYWGNPKMECCCQTPISAASSSSASLMVEAWQARPDGIYPSLRPGKDDSDCRTRVVVDPSSRVNFRTVAPGSVGSLGGLVPSSSFDWMPYKPPVLHILVTTVSAAADSRQHHQQQQQQQPLLLVDVPLLFHPKTLQAKNFSMASFWRGPEYTKLMMMKSAAAATNRKKEALSSPIQVSSWIPRPNENLIDISLNVFLPPHWDDNSNNNNHHNSKNKEPTEQFCNALPFGFPASFFIEPIVTCAPSLLDFFDL